jgi:hypothetical protein
MTSWEGKTINETLGRVHRAGEGALYTGVPIGALFRAGAEWGVFVLDGGKAKLQHVKIGPRNDLEATVDAGLASGTQVIIHPSDQVQNGKSVVARSRDQRHRNGNQNTEIPNHDKTASQGMSGLCQIMWSRKWARQ